MIRVGLVNMDTSHPRGFAEAMKNTEGIGYYAIFDDSFRTPEEIESFIQTYGLEKRCERLEELVELCDIGFIQGCDWDRHLSYAEAFLKRNKPVFIDKPLVGNLRDCHKILEWAEKGAVILGSSSTRYAEEIQDFLATPASERGEIMTVYGSVGLDEFNYGIHVVEAIGGLLGSGAEWVNYIGTSQCKGQIGHSYMVGFSNQKNAIFTIVEGEWQPFCLQIITTQNTYQINLKVERLYQALIKEIATFMKQKDNKMAKPNALVESIQIMLCAAKSRKLGRKVNLRELNYDEQPYNGEKFWEEYRKKAYSSK